MVNGKTSNSIQNFDLKKKIQLEEKFVNEF